MSTTNTAITRARVRVVLYESDPVNRAPLFYYLERRGLCDKVSVLGGDESLMLLPHGSELQREMAFTGP